MRFATLVECPAERMDTAPLGETGILEIYESERKHGYIAAYELSLPPLRYYRTAIHPMRGEEGLTILDFENGQRYAFEIIDSQRKR